MTFYKQLLAGLVTAFLSQTVLASTVYWTDWQSTANNQNVSGQISDGSNTIGVSFSSTSPYSFVDLGSDPSHPNYWTGSAYTNGSISNAPTAKELIALNAGGAVTITFDEAVENPYIALLSWNINVGAFSNPIVFNSYGEGYFGSSTPIALPSAFYSLDELHGVVQLFGTVTSFTFVHSSENWHGITIGVDSVPTSDGGINVPVPGAVWLFGSSLITLLGFSRRKA